MKDGHRAPSGQPGRMLDNHTKCRDHQLAESFYKQCANHQISRGAPLVGTEGERCYEMLRIANHRVQLKWALHAWIALGHHKRFLSGYHFEASMQEHKLAGSNVYSDIYCSKEFYKDIARAGRKTVAHFQKKELAKAMAMVVTRTVWSRLSRRRHCGNTW